MVKPTSTQEARPGRLRYVPDSSLRIQRVHKAGGVQYLLKQEVLRDERILKRIRALVIPPAWTDVRICERATGHLQAVGRDARGRKQYIYHPDWRALRDQQKFQHLLAFGRALPRIRRRVRRDLNQRHLTKTKVLAALVQLLEASRIRVGNEEYARQNNSFGLTTLRDRHVRIRGAHLRFEYRGKSGKEHVVELRDAVLARVVARCQEIPGQDLFQYFDEHGRRQRVKSGDVNQYLREISGGDFTAKDFRTWAGTVLMTKALRILTAYKPDAAARKSVDQAVKAVAACLGNTPSICRKSYVHPVVIDSYLAGSPLWTCKDSGLPIALGLRREETTVMHLLGNGASQRNRPPTRQRDVSPPRSGVRSPRTRSPRRLMAMNLNGDGVLKLVG